MGRKGRGKERKEKDKWTERKKGKEQKRESKGGT